MNGRRAKQRRRAEREHSGRVLAAVRAAVPVLLRMTDDGDNEVWQRGPATMVVPVVPLDGPTELQDAVTVYRMAVLTGDCPRCENEVRVSKAGGYYVRHAAVCPADPDRLVALAEEHGVEARLRL